MSVAACSLPRNRAWIHSVLSALMFYMVTSLVFTLLLVVGVRVAIGMARYQIIAES